MQILLTPRLPVLLTVAVPLLLVCQSSTGLRLLLAVATPLLMPLLVCQPNMGLGMLLAVMVSLLLPLLVGHAVQIVPLAVSCRQPIPGGDVHSNRSASS